MAKPSGSMKTIQTTDGVNHEIIPDKVGSGNYYASLDTLTADGKILSVTPVTDNTFRIYGQSVGFYRLTQVTTIYTHATSTSSPYIVTGRSGDIIHIVRIENNITYWVMYGGLEITALLGGTVSSSSSDMYTPIADISAIKGSYIKSATVSGNDLILTKQDNTTITFSGGGSGSSDSIDTGFHYKYTGETILSTSILTLDLVNYIDNYVQGAEYEICFRLYGSNGYNVNIYTDLFTQDNYSVYGGSGDFAPTTHIMPAKRYIYAKKNNSTYMQIELRGWRRVK